MTSAEIFGIVGAGAWIPQIAAWVHAYMSKPKLSVIAASRFSLTFNHLGPMVNLDLVIAASRKDAVVTKIALELVHEKGEKHTLIWKWLRDLQFQIEGLGEQAAAQFTKAHEALAIKVSTSVLAEQQIRFEEPDFTVWFSKTTSDLFEQYLYLKTQHTEALSQLKLSKEFRDAKAQFSDRIHFKEGEYRCKIYITELTLKHKVVAEFIFSLSRSEVERLRANAIAFESFFEQWVVAQEGGVASWPKWNWASPTLRTTGESLQVLVKG